MSNESVQLRFILLNATNFHYFKLVPSLNSSKSRPLKLQEKLCQLPVPRNYFCNSTSPTSQFSTSPVSPSSPSPINSWSNLVPQPIDSIHARRLPVLVLPLSAINSHFPSSSWQLPIITTIGLFSFCSRIKISTQIKLIKSIIKITTVARRERFYYNNNQEKLNKSQQLDRNGW